MIMPKPHDFAHAARAFTVHSALDGEMKAPGDGYQLGPSKVCRKNHDDDDDDDDDEIVISYYWCVFFQKIMNKDYLNSDHVRSLSQ